MEKRKKTSCLVTSKENNKENKNISEDYKKAVYKTIICNFSGFICVITAYYFTQYLEPNFPKGINMSICSFAIVILVSIIYVLFKKL